MWPSAFTTYGVKTSGNTTDVVKAVAAAAADKRSSVLLLVEIDGEKSFVPVRLAA